MITIKLPFTATADTLDRIVELQRRYSPFVRTAYKRAMEGVYEKEIRAYLKKFGEQDSWFTQSCVKERNCNGDC